MADIGSYILPYIQKLPGLVDSEGVIIPEQATEAQSTIEMLQSYYPDLDISVDTNNRIVVANETCETPAQLQTKLLEEGEKRAENEFFNNNGIYAGIITTTGVEEFARALTFACGAKAVAAPFGTSSYSVTSEWFDIRVTPSIEGTPVSVKVNFGSTIMYDVFNYDTAISQNAPYLKYMICKGSKGDCYVKGYYTSDSTVPDPDNVEEEFKDCEMGAFDYIIPQQGADPVLTMNAGARLDLGGFALVGMASMIDEKKVLGTSTWSSSAYYEAAERYSIVLWKKGGVPLVVHSNGLGRFLEEKFSGNPWKRVITNASSQIVSRAPIFTPGSRYYASIFSYWAMLSSKDGVYEFSTGDYGQSYRFDHGFVISI